MADPQERVYAEFSTFDWSSFTEFKEGLGEILQGHLESLQERDPSVKTIPAAEKQQLTDQAKSFFFCSSTGHILNLDDYYAWKRNNGGKITLLEESSKEEDVSDDKDSSEAPYSSNYQELVDLIVSGKPVPGIKEIPDTVLSDKSSEPKAEKRVKPWEKCAAANKPNVLDMTTS
ncbi:hypothetical protein METBIDRAFT_67792 [Metschnikowia bicuspidata var. bicuspidata NRRL YB-4993]|uniref:Uncharacterized protein n=1 Tax=Metschnikowia bicuspidata var. bicuspidata NRRL YB-4993 TaxID=869754 RepID=A0A1A0HDT3_9ASCO|nr:hypothetical protein METBIDRAFT_67792 [Metschnikowia bicuspidata var. bicuspidata NRRL YB-4993]OBA22249.1 hypothetical protein METBIDRAFT_67792 [Metschnikowia bicuspidata var. bicuspidata NRRL YB-4993]